MTTSAKNFIADRNVLPLWHIVRTSAIDLILDPRWLIGVQVAYRLHYDYRVYIM